jgi:hypothetical protein
MPKFPPKAILGITLSLNSGNQTSCIVKHNPTTMRKIPAHIYITVSLFMINGVDFNTKKPFGVTDKTLSSLKSLETELYFATLDIQMFRSGQPLWGSPHPTTVTRERGK